MKRKNLQTQDFLASQGLDFGDETCKVFETYKEAKSIYEATKKALGREEISYSSISGSTTSEIIVLNNATTSTSTKTKI